MALVALTAGVVVVPISSATAEVICTSDECDGGAWLAARGPANENSYWSMSPGHNCTNYVAWRLISAGVERPPTHPGNAADWAFRAIVDGFRVDTVPLVGAVAQWDANASGYGPDGHVAYVEAINDDGTILVSEDFWLDGAQTGPLTYRTVDPATVSNFIHYADISAGLREVLPSPSGWQVRGTRLMPEVSAMSATQFDESGTHVYFAEAGELREATQANGAWSVTPTGIPSTASALVAVGMRERPFVMSLDGGVLYMNVDTPSGWQRMSTGIEISGEITAVDLGGLWPTVFVSQGGSLYRVWGDNEGWHAETTGIEVWGPVSAVVSPTGWPEVYSLKGTTVFRAWQDATGWHEESTGVTATGRVVATAIGDSATLVFATDGMLHQARQSSGVWVDQPLGVHAGTAFTTINVGLTDPVIIQVG